MKKNLRLSMGAALGAVAALALSSCAYDPYYSSTTFGGSYSSGYSGGGYGDGYGYGGSSFNTSLFVSTGNSQWGYDPYTYSYYDYRRRAYYDPYLYGYYPVGYRPPVVYGVPHPHGWRPGRSSIAPPSRVTNLTVVNYRNRESAYKNTRYDWARQVRQAPVSSGRSQVQRSTRDYQESRESRGTRYDSGSRYEAPARYETSPSRQNPRTEPRRPQVPERQAPARSRNRFVSTPSMEQASREEVPSQATRQSMRKAPQSMRQSEGRRPADPRAQRESRRQDRGSRQDAGRGSSRGETQDEPRRGRGLRD